jgi:Zn-dependent peptidase ImmA (M78 family)
MSEARINPSMLSWALRRSGLDASRAAQKLGTTTDRVISWQEGGRKPTFLQAKSIAEITHIPFGYLYLAEPPDEPLPIADFRTLGDEPVIPLSPDFRELLNDVLRKQTWYREYRQRLDAGPVSSVGRFRVSDPAMQIAADIKSTLAITAEDRVKSRTWEDYLTVLISRIEGAGILVMRSGVVGNNSHRPLSVEEFRGFVLADPFAPVVFLNGKDAKAAQIFTLIHELAHLWIGVSGVSNQGLGMRHDRNGEVERLCNAIAAEFLVPAEEIRLRWCPGKDFSLQVREFAREFRVSAVVVGRRAVELGLAAWDRYRIFFQAERAAWEAAAARKSSGGGNPYRTSAVRNSKLLTKAVLETALEGRMLLRDAGHLLNVAPANLRKLASSVYGEK